MQEFKTITEEQLKRVQSICREWLSNPATNRTSRLTIPAGTVLSHDIAIEIKSILTFDNVLITSAVDAEAGVCYTRLIAKSGEPGTFIDATLEMIAASQAPPAARQSSAVRSLETTTRDAIRPRRDRGTAFETNSTTEKYLLCSNGKVLGYSALERTKSENQRTGRFFPSDDYFEFAEIFAEFPEVENDCLEANVREAYGLTDDQAGVFRKKFSDLCERIEALELYVIDESGTRMAATEVKLEDLSAFYRDETERWLHVGLTTPLQSR